LKFTIIYIQPLGEVNQQYLIYLKKSIKEFYGYDCVIKTKFSFINDILQVAELDMKQVKYSTNSAPIKMF
jgi:hypothetical protein